MKLKPGLRVRMKDGGGEGIVVKMVKVERYGLPLVEVKFLASATRVYESHLSYGMQPKRIEFDRLEVWNHETKLYEPASVSDETRKVSK